MKLFDPGEPGLVQGFGIHCFSIRIASPPGSGGLESQPNSVAQSGVRPS